ncbi:MAG: hypothetical protein JWQ70_2473, partial [Aeromicrobium sp.]|nr:hypothetical protein [Aeromicrobium sp.]
MDIKEAAHIDAAEHTDGDIAGNGSVLRRRILVAGLSGTALSLVPLLARRAGASGRSPAATSSSTASSTENSTDSGFGGTSNTTSGSGANSAGGNATAGTNGGYNGTGDSTNTTTVDTSGGSAGSTAGSSANSTGGSTADTAAATTTTAPPRRPTDEDIAVLSFAQSMELTIRDLYDIAISLGSFADAQLETVNAIRDAHESYGQSISGLLGRSAPNSSLTELFSAMKGDFA